MNPAYNEKNYGNFTWIDIFEPEKFDLNEIASKYNLDYYLITDSQQIGHLPKYEKRDDYNFLILRAFTGDLNQRITNIKELSSKIAFFYSDQRLVTIHRKRFSFLENIDSQFEDSQQMLLYIISKMVDTFEEPASLLLDKMDEIEQIIFLKDHSKISLEDLYFQKSQTRISKKLLQITQNVIGQIQIDTYHQSALQDIKDTLLGLILSYDEVSEDSYNLLHTYMSVSAQRSNDVMKLLTIFSAFFLPLTFIVGVYGMNFDNMPELRWTNGYFLSLGLMAIIALGIYIWFKRKNIIK